MVKRAVQTAIVLGMVLMIFACAGGISEQARSQVTYSGAFGNVLDSPDAYRGETVMWGGRVIEIQNQGGFTEILALQLPLDRRYRPADSDHSQGRFMVRTTRFLDPVIYPPGALITVVGRLQGAETRRIGEMDYRYPVIDVVELEKYDPTRNNPPRLHIGIGFGGSF